MAPRAGLEPATIRLTAECSTIELPRNLGNKKITLLNYNKNKITKKLTMLIFIFLP